MHYSNCPRCRLSVRIRAHYLTMEHCPRCRARAQVVMPMFSSSLPIGPRDACPPAVGAPTLPTAEPA